MKDRVRGLLAVAAIWGGSAHAATVTVTGVADTVVNDGAVTLREAITSLNVGVDITADVAAVGAYGTDDRIEFDIPGAGVHTIVPTGPLPPLGVPMTLDGYTQPGASPNTQAVSDDAVLLVEIDGVFAGLGAVGFQVTAAASGSVIRGLVINRFAADPMLGGGHAILLDSATDCVIAGNFLGTDAAGSTALGNTGDGVRTKGQATFNLVGGADPGDRNVIAGNGSGVALWHDSYRNRVSGNFIGIDAAGTGAIPNQTGVFVNLETTLEFTVIGRYAIDPDTAGNVISGNAGPGILVANQSRNTFIWGNLIGTDPSGQNPVPNQGDGVRITDGYAGTSRLTYIGELVPGSSANTIAFNLGNGIDILGVAPNFGDNLQHPIGGNRIFANGGLGIDLGDDGVTVNDPGDGDGGQNDLQNYPVLATAVSGPGGTAITGDLDSSPGTELDIFFFANSACDPSGHGEGETYLGHATLTTDGAGHGSIDRLLPAAVSPGAFVTAIATVSDTLGDSSEFSPCVAVEAAAVTIPALAPPGRILLILALAAAALLALGYKASASPPTREGRREP